MPPGMNLEQMLKVMAATERPPADRPPAEVTVVIEPEVKPARRTGKLNQ